MNFTARCAMAAVSTVLVFAACSSSNSDTPGGGQVSTDGGVLLDDGAVVACGRTTTLCPAGTPCTSADDCASHFCQDICTEASHVNGVKDDGETGVDCGGTAPKKCPVGQGCASNADCDNLLCDVGKTNVCLPPSHTDGLKNGDETGVDCGGPTAPKCTAGQGCKTNADCNNLACDPGTLQCLPQSNTDGVKNGDETGIDCGGPTAPNKCPPGQGCASNGDCANTLCNTTTLVCDPPSATDGLKNGTETDVDCGGGAPTNAPKCAIGQACAAGDANCASNVCNYANKCVEAPSCRKQHGGDTCGPEGANESCCISPPVTHNVGNPPVATTVHLDKYSITAGRMRTFVEDPAINGNIHDWLVNHKPAWWVDAWTAYLPTVMDNGGSSPDDGTPWSGFYQDVGPIVHTPAAGGNTGCVILNFGARTYRLPDAVNTRMNDEQDYPQAFLDERALNCTPMPIFAAFCAWDGGQLADKLLLNDTWGLPGRTYPWGNPAAPDPMSPGHPAGYEVAHPTEPVNGAGAKETYGPYQGSQFATTFYAPDEKWASFNMNYWGGATQAFSAKCNGGAGGGNYCDQSIFVAPPGRFPNGNTPSGHADIAGNVFNMTPDPAGANYYWSQNGSWEGHPIPFGNSTFPIYNKYLAAGARCVRP